MYIQKRTLYTSDLIDLQLHFPYGKNNSLYRLSIFTKKIQLKASIPSTCSSVNISGHMFACNGKATTKTCLLHIYTIH